MQVDVRDRRAILFDALGTLVALEPPAAPLRAELLRRFGVEITGAAARRAIATEIAFYRDHLDEGRDPASLAALRRRCANVLREALGATHLDLDRVTEALLSALRFIAFGDARAALTAARARGQRVVVVSNWDVSLHDVLARIGLGQLLDGIVTSAEAGARKPCPAIFERALRLAQVAPDEAVHVGDSFEEDIIGARNAGIEPILIQRDGAPGPDDVPTIATLGSLV
jgi:putative hydrolase of the HAD superfamily